MSPVKMLAGAVIDDGLVMQGVPGRVHAFEHAAGELEALAVLRDRRCVRARSGRISPYSCEYSSSPYTARVPAMSFDGSIM